LYPTDHGSIITMSKSVTPRRRMASCQRGSFLTASSVARNSSSMTGGWTLGSSAQWRTSPAVIETVAS
jgi:hypothetical protein